MDETTKEDILIAISAAIITGITTYLVVRLHRTIRAKVK